MNTYKGQVLFLRIKALIKNVLVYMRNFGISALVDLGIFTIVLYFTKGMMEQVYAIFISTLVARIFSSLINYQLNKNLFIGKGVNKKSMIRYYILWASLIVLSASGTYLINHKFKIWEVLAKSIGDISLGIFSYLTQKYWVFKKGDMKREKGFLFKISRNILRIFKRRKLELDLEIFKKPGVLVGHHQNFYGPISCLIWMPDSVDFWVIGHLFDYKETFKVYYNYTFKEKIKLPRVLAFILASISSLLITSLVRSSGAIPVYRGSKKIRNTIRDSIDHLEDGGQLMIFPDLDYGSRDDKIGEIYPGFLSLEKFYYQRNQEHLPFYPIVTNKKEKIIKNKEPIFFKSDDLSFKEEEQLVVEELVKRLNEDFI